MEREPLKLDSYFYPNCAFFVNQAGFIALPNKNVLQFGHSQTKLFNFYSFVNLDCQIPDLTK